jgi:alpha-D-ribose 1-methylphosphonate 5-triphosphate synthase subunit PhnH
MPERAETVELILRLTGSHNVPLAEADYVLTDGDSLAQVLSEVKTGDLEYPDRSATVVCRVSGLHADAGLGLRLSLAGPGIDGSQDLTIHGIGSPAVEAIQVANGFAPQGVELVLVTPDGRFACLTRYTRLTEVQ